MILSQVLMSHSLADYDRKARNQAMSMGFYWIINTPVILHINPAAILATEKSII
jgi:hypothetical protein